MKTAKKRHDGLGGWETTVTTDDGIALTVELIRGPYHRNWFGNATYLWTARVSGPDWSHEMAAFQGDSAQHLARRGLGARRALDEAKGAK